MCADDIMRLGKGFAARKTTERENQSGMQTTMQGNTCVPVTERALYQRIDRKLRKEDGECLRTCRGGKWETTLGRYYSVNIYRNSIESMNIPLEKWGRELGVLKPWETVVLK